MQKTNINPEILQAFLESAVNAADKGQSQFFTPTDFGRKLAAGLPKCRPAICDLNCGNGQLLQASARLEEKAAHNSTQILYGADIDPCHVKEKDENGKAILDKKALPIRRITHDLTRLYPILKEARADQDLFVLNPPWRLFWHRDRLADLAESDLSSVRDAFAGIEGGAPRGTIDSTVATLLMALDLCTYSGEGMLIANNNTLERLIFGERAPHAAIAKHVWLRLVIPGNPMTGIQDCQWQDEQQFHTGVIYFARAHTVGVKTVQIEDGDWPDLAGLRAYRQGAEIQIPQQCNTDLPEYWAAAKERVAEIQGREPRVPWNLWLTVGGRIKTSLSLFQKVSRKLDKQEAERLFRLNGKAPMELVLQRADRDELLDVLGDPETSPWRVHPELRQAVDRAIRDYHAARAPLYPLSKIQRLGYLDEQDEIECVEDLATETGRVVFKQGRSYPLRTQTVSVERKRKKPNPQTGEDEELELSGQDLAIFLTATEHAGQDPADADEYCFMDATLKNDKETTVGSARRVRKGVTDTRPPIDFTLQQLADHFNIPEVPDVATNNPQGYEANLKLLEELEAICT